MNKCWKVWQYHTLNQHTAPEPLKPATMLYGCRSKKGKNQRAACSHLLCRMIKQTNWSQTVAAATACNDHLQLRFITGDKAAGSGNNFFINNALFLIHVNDVMPQVCSWFGVHPWLYRPAPCACSPVTKRWENRITPVFWGEKTTRVSIIWFNFYVGTRGAATKTWIISGS